MQEFREKIAVVTGAGSGIGRALTLGFAHEGMHVALADLDEGALAATAALVTEAAPGVEAMTKGCDVSQASAVVSLADAVYDRWGQVDVVCNNAGCSWAV